MKKCLILIFLLLAFILAACSGEAQTQVVVEPTTPAALNPTATAVKTPVVTSPTATGTEEVMEIESQAGMGCTAVNAQNDAPSPYAEIFDPTDYDWAYGPDTAAVTIVEYSDFQ